MARESEPRLAADLMRISLELDKEAIRIEAAFRGEPEPANVA